MRFFLFYFSKCIYFCGYPIVLAPFVAKAILPPISCICTSSKNNLCTFGWVNFWIFYSGPVINVSIPPPVPHSLTINSKRISLGIGFSYFILLLQNSFFLQILVHLCFHINFRKILSRSTKKILLIY